MIIIKPNQTRPVVPPDRVRNLDAYCLFRRRFFLYVDISEASTIPYLLW